MKVGVRELKARLSEYLDRAAGGEIIEVTARGRPKALLTPLEGRVRIEEGIAEGWITPGNRQSPGGLRRRVPSDTTIRELLDEDRGE